MAKAESPQVRYIRKRKAKGQCLRCQDNSMPERVLCKECTKKMRVAQRIRKGGAAWVEGKRGRPPIHD